MEGEGSWGVGRGAGWAGWADLMGCWAAGLMGWLGWLARALGCVGLMSHSTLGLANKRDGFWQPTKNE